VPGPQGVRGRNSDNTRLRQVLGWEPEISLEEGLTRTYEWIEKQVRSMLTSGQVMTNVIPGASYPIAPEASNPAAAPAGRP